MRRDTQSGPCRLSMKRGGKPRPAHTIPSTILPVTERNVKLNLYQNGNSRGRWPLTKQAFAAEVVPHHWACPVHYTGRGDLRSPAFQISVYRAAFQSLPLMREVARRAGGREKGSGFISPPVKNRFRRADFCQPPRQRGPLRALFSREINPNLVRLAEKRPLLSQRPLGFWGRRN